MAFHIEVRTGLRHARSFNLNSEELRRTVLDPWLSGRPVQLGDRKWDRDEAELRVLEGPELSNPELSFGQGWANAERASNDVTERVLGAAQEARGRGGGPAALVIEAESAVRTVADIASSYGARSVDLESIAEQIDGRDPEIAAVIVVVQRGAGR
jgi:hypothetical protein